MKANANAKPEPAATTAAKPASQPPPAPAAQPAARQQEEVTVRVKASTGGLIRGEVVTLPLDGHTLSLVDAGYLEPTHDPAAAAGTGRSRPTRTT